MLDFNFGKGPKEIAIIIEGAEMLEIGIKIHPDLIPKGLRPTAEGIILR